jgi:peptidoglycan LD-endopeptidase CwlK
MDANSEERLNHVHPLLAQKIRQLAQMLSAEGLEIRVAEGLRLWSVQQAYFAQGREPLDIVNEMRRRAFLQPIDTVANIRRITNAPPGYSQHQFGLAVDCDPDDPTRGGYQIDWNADHPQWKRMEQVGVSLGLESGANWVRLFDAPHFQLTGKLPTTPTEDMRSTYLSAGIQAVWETTGLEIPS